MTTSRKKRPILSRRNKPKPQAKAIKSTRTAYTFDASQYPGASAPIRDAKRGLAPITMRTPGSVTSRDQFFLVWLSNEFDALPFERLNLDAGAMSRMLGHGFIKHVGGDLGSERAKFRLTSEGSSKAQALA